MRFESRNVGSAYLDALNYKFETIEYHLQQLEEAQDSPDHLISVRANFDGLMFQLHTTHDVVSQIVNESVHLGMKVSSVDLSKVIRILTDTNVHQTICTNLQLLWDATHYTRDYVNFSKHRSIIEVYTTTQTYFLSSSFPARFVIVRVKNFDKDGRLHDGGSPLAIAKRELEQTQGSIDAIMNEVDVTLDCC